MVTRTYTSHYVRLLDATRVVYPGNPRYLALPGMGGADQKEVNRRAVLAEIAIIDAEVTAASAASGSRKRRT